MTDLLFWAEQNRRAGVNAFALFIVHKENT